MMGKNYKRGNFCWCCTDRDSLGRSAEKHQWLAEADKEPDERDDWPDAFEW